MMTGGGILPAHPILHPSHQRQGILWLHPLQIVQVIEDRQLIEIWLLPLFEFWSVERREAAVRLRSGSRELRREKMKQTNISLRKYSRACYWNEERAWPAIECVTKCADGFTLSVMVCACCVLIKTCSTNDLSFNFRFFSQDVLELSSQDPNSEPACKSWASSNAKNQEANACDWQSSEEEAAQRCTIQSERKQKSA